MRHILIVVAAFAAFGFIASNPASAQQSTPPYMAGGPDMVASWCKVSTDGNPEVDAFGYYAPYGGQALAQAPRSRKDR